MKPIIVSIAAVAAGMVGASLCKGINDGICSNGLLMLGVSVGAITLVTHSINPWMKK